MGLPLAAEACFSLEQHLACLVRRVERLSGIDVLSDVDREMCEFVHGELAPRAADLARTLSEIRGAADELSHEDRCLSPSDFGFHNALMRPGGEVCFMDFEYAGWDDPAKLVCDFFHQVAVPVAPGFLPAFAQAIAGLTQRPGETLQRIAQLLPVYRLKWCCIVLNDFLSDGRDRRGFALGAPPTTRKAEQLSKARRILERTLDVSKVA